MQMCKCANELRRTGANDGGEVSRLRALHGLSFPALFLHFSRTFPALLSRTCAYTEIRASCCHPSPRLMKTNLHTHFCAACPSMEATFETSHSTRKRPFRSDARSGDLAPIVRPKHSHKNRVERDVSNVASIEGAPLSLIRKRSAPVKGDSNLHKLRYTIRARACEKSRIEREVRRLRPHRSPPYACATIRRSLFAHLHICTFIYSPPYASPHPSTNAKNFLRAQRVG